MKIDAARCEIVVCDGVTGGRAARVGWMRKHLTARLAERELDVVHFPFASGPFDYEGAAVVTQHDTVRFQLRSATSRAAVRERGRIDRQIAQAGWHVIVPSGVEAEVFATHTGVARSRVAVVHHGVSDAMRVDDPVEARTYAVWAGSPYRHKNVETLTEAWRVFGRRGVDAPRLRLIGAADGVADLPDGATAEAAVAHEQLAGVYQHALVMLFPSKYESFGLPVLEAMAAGTPVIGSRLPVFEELFGERMLMVDADDPAAWADAVARLASDAALWERLSRGGRDHAAGFTWERCARETAAVYRGAIG
ncbi:MAG: hypothetical protein CMJ49_12335 [Planctomycetaceae bacterium]|nr:hypothetical protein [Planctomycetaceae bacterium]